METAHALTALHNAIQRNDRQAISHALNRLSELNKAMYPWPILPTQASVPDGRVYIIPDRPTCWPQNAR